MATRLRKTRRYRGSRYHGWGQVGQHRKSGRKGGRGMAGRMKHKWTYTVKYDADHFGRPPFRRPGVEPIKKWINVGELDSISMGAKSKSKVKDLDLRSMGYEKLLGSGKVTESYKVIVDRFSSRAEEKVRGAGGEIVRG